MQLICAPVVDHERYIDSMWDRNDNTYYDEIETAKENFWNRIFETLETETSDAVYFVKDEPIIKDGISRNVEYVITRSIRDCRFQLTSFFVKKDMQGNYLLVDAIRHSDINDAEKMDSEVQGMNFICQCLMMDELNMYEF